VCYPATGKKANVTPVYKNNNPNDVKDYRPISLLSVISKCMERCVYKYVHNFSLLNNIITSNQSGFTFGDSAINQLVNIPNDFGRASELYSVTLVKPLIGYGIRDYCLN
jgi:hypothetical protein